MADFFSFDSLEKAFGAYTSFTVAKNNAKAATVTQAQQRKVLEVQAAEQEAANKVKIIDAAAAFSRQENLFALASTVAVGLSAALAAAGIVKLIKIMK